ncbi:MAG: gamma-glutamyltransferase [Candidatus Aminicenantes bacterium]|nr:MAG: gamma-glutamyltransferase [Candidatus Aminicenantes bacterium]
MDIRQIESSFCPSADGKAAEALNGMIATAAPEATAAGVEVLRKGGNAVDAAVAAAMALGVCESQASGLGGQTMMLIYTGEKVIAVDGSSRSPSLAHVNAIYKLDRSNGYRATTVPSTPAVLWYVHNRYGTRPWEEILEPAIQLAQEGSAITPLQHHLQKRELKEFNNVESKSGAKYFLNDGQPYKTLSLFKQPDLAELLKKISQKGIEEFYEGGIAKIIDADMRENGGLLRYDDLTLIPWPIIRKALKRRFREATVYTMPLPAAGRTLLFTLLMLDHLPLDTFREMDYENKKIHLLVEVLRKAFLERSDRPFDPNFYPQLVKKDMLRRKYARQSIREILKNVDKTILSTIASEDELSGETTHLSVMDNKGMAVSLTQSIERVYGSKAAAAGLGFLYNNYLMDYEYSLVNHPFYLRPNKPPWATVAPTMLFLGDDLWMVLGSPGSERIISTLAQFLLHVMDGNLSIEKAMKAPRMHCSLGGRISLEADRFSPGLLEFLKKKGYRLDIREPFAFYLGCIQAVLKRHTGSGFQGIADVRREGAAKGL